MSYIEQTSFFSGPCMAFSNAQIRVLDRHGVPGKGDHFSAFGNMEVMEARVTENGLIRAGRRISLLEKVANG